MNRKWADLWLETLSLNMRSSRKGIWNLFNPTANFYAKLESGEDNDLEAIAIEIGGHLELHQLPSVTYE